MKKRHFYTQGLAALCIQLMIFAAIPVPIGAQDETMRVETSIDIGKIIIPTEYGKIEEKFEGLEDPLIVHIQDVHANYEAQRNIAAIMEQLAGKNDIHLYGIEGASGPFMTDKFHVFNNKSVRRKVADYFLKTGRFNGAEYLTYSDDIPVTLYGIEDAKTYMDHFLMFRKPMEFSREFKNYYEQARIQLDKIRDKIYSEELKELDRKIQAQENGELTLVDFSNYLKDVLIRHNFILKDYKNFARLVTLDHLEKQIDFDNVNKERNGLLNYMGPRLEEAEIQEIRAVSLDFSNDRMTSDDYYKYLKRLADRKELDITRFPNIAFYFKYLEMYENLDFAELVKEKNELVAQLKEQLFTSDDQRTINRISDALLLMNRLFALRVSNQEFNQYQELKNTITDSWIKNNLVSIAQKYDVPDSFTASFDFQSKFPVIDDFYRLAKVRDNELLNNTISFMREEDSNTAVLISGGFHTPGMTELMRKKDISYMVVSPTITGEHDYGNYIKNMTGQEDTMDSLFSLQLPETSIIPPPAPTAVESLDPGVQELVINSSVLYNLALEIAIVIEENIDLTDKTYLTPSDQALLFGLLGGEDYLQRISRALKVDNVAIDLQNLRVEGGNKGILFIPITLFDMSFVIVYRHPEYTGESSLIAELDARNLPYKNIPALDIKLYFEGTITSEPKLLDQDPFINILRNRVIAPIAPELVPDILSAVETAVETDVAPGQLGIKIEEDVDDNKPLGRIQAYPEPGRGDSLVVFNVNGSGLVGLSKPFANQGFNAFDTVSGLDVTVYTMTRYSDDLDAKAAYDRVTNDHSLGRVLAENDITQARIAGEDRVVALTEAFDGNTAVDYTPNQFALVEVSVPPQETLRQTPSYNSGQIADEAIRRLNDEQDGLMIANFSAPDALAQTGDIMATANALDIMDQEIARVVQTAIDQDVTILISSSHGNVENMLDANGRPISGRYFNYTTNRVPFMYIDPRDPRITLQPFILREEDTTVASIAPTVLEILGIDKPEAMTAPSLFADFVPQQNDRVLLITIDGLGITDDSEGNALQVARQQLAQRNRMLNLDTWMNTYPYTTLDASGESVGLRSGTPGYPHAAYYAMGSGLAPEDIVLDMVRIDREIESNDFYRNSVFEEALDNVKLNNTKLHLLGLVSEAEMDSSITHLEALLRMAKDKGLPRDSVVIHAITDGIDEAPQSISDNIKRVIELTQRLGIGVVSTAGGRAWFMNLEPEYDRIEQAYNVLVAERLQQELEDVAGVVILPEDVVLNSLGLREALAIVRQQYGSKVKIGVMTDKGVPVMQRILRVNNVLDKIDFIVSEPEFGSYDPAVGLIDSVVGFVQNRYPAITDPQRQIAIITLDPERLGPDAADKARVFVQERPQSDDEVYSVSNAVFVSVMAIEGNDSVLADYEGWAMGNPGVLRTIKVQRNFLEQLNRQREINTLFETAA